MRKNLLILLLFSGAIFCSPSKSYATLSLTSARDSLSILDSLIFYSRSNNKKQFSYIGKVIHYVEKNKSISNTIKGNRLIGDIYSKYFSDSSFIYYSKALKLAGNDHKSEKTKIFLSLALIYKSAQDLKQSLQYLDSALRISQENKDYRLLTAIYNVYGNIKRDIQDKENAKAMYDSSFNIAKRNLYYSDMGVSLANIARFDTVNKSAIKKLKEALSYLNKAKDNGPEKPQIMIAIGYRFTNPDSSLFYHTKALELAKSGDFKEIQMAAYNNMAYSYLEMGNIPMAEECVQKGIQLAKQDNNHDWLSSLYDTYADILNSKGDFKSSATWQKKALAEKILADKKQSAGQVRLLAALLDTKNKEIIIRNKENEILTQNNKLQTMRFWLVIAIILIIAATFIFYWLQQRSRMKLKNEEVNSAKKLIEMEESEKGRLARELHDITGQFVMGITSEIENLEIPSSEVKNEIKDKIRTLGKSIRAISHRMNRAMLEHFTFEELMNGQCEDVQKLTGIPIFLTMPEKEVNLSREVVTHLHRIVQELLTNAGKYAKEGEVYVEFSVEPGGLKLAYSDTGPGFDMKKVEMNGMGLMNIFERAKLLGGNAKMQSSPGNGTTWDVFIPLSKN